MIIPCCLPYQGVPSAAFFITSTGSTLSASRVSRCIMRIGKRLHPSLEGNLKGSRIRKGVISLDRENISSSTTTKSMLARQMTHSTATADQYNAVNSKLVEKGKVAEYIERLTLPQTITKTKSPPKKIKVLEEESSESENTEEGDGSPMQERIEESVNADVEIEDKGKELGQQHVEEEKSEDVEKENEDREINENLTNQEKDESQRPNNEEKESDSIRAEVEEPSEGEEEPDLEEKEQSKEVLPQRRSKEDGLSIQQKKELIRIFGAKHLGKGIVPQRHIVLFRAARNPTLKALNVDDAMNYLRRKCTFDLPGRAKVMSWVSSQGKSINQIETSSTASFPGRRFTEYQGDIIHRATASLPDSAKMKDIMEKIKNDKTCSEYGIMDMFTRQQLRDKFVNIRKKLRKISF